MVSATVKEDASTTQVSRQVQDMFENYEAPAGYTVEIEGEIDRIMEYMGDLLLIILVAVLCIYLIMVVCNINCEFPCIPTLISIE